MSIYHICITLKARASKYPIKYARLRGYEDYDSCFIKDYQFACLLNVDMSLHRDTFKNYIETTCF